MHGSSHSASLLQGLPLTGSVRTDFLLLVELATHTPMLRYIHRLHAVFQWLLVARIGESLLQVAWDKKYDSMPHCVQFAPKAGVHHCFNVKHRLPFLVVVDKNRTTIHSSGHLGRFYILMHSRLGVSIPFLPQSKSQVALFNLHG